MLCESKCLQKILVKGQNWSKRREASMRTFLINSYDTVWGSPQFQNRVGVSILHRIILYEKKMEAVRVIWIEGKVINFFTYILFYMKKFEAIGVTCKTDITASKKNLVF